MKFISIMCITALLATVPTASISKPPERSVAARIGEGLGLTPRQIELLGFAKQVAIEDGHQKPQYFLGILMQESKLGGIKEHRVAGLENRPGNRYFGIAQIKLKAAIAVMRKWPEMWGFLDTKTEEELQARLILDDEFNIRVASKYALLMGINERPNRAIAAYNRGPGGVEKITDPKTFPYTVKVKEHAKQVEKYTWD